MMASQKDRRLTASAGRYRGSTNTPHTRRSAKKRLPEGNSAVERAARLLRMLGRGRPSRGHALTELTSEAGLHKTTALRLLRSLERTGLVDRSSDGRFRVGLQLIELASAYLGDLDLVQQARPVLGDLVAATGETVHLGILAGTEIVYVDKVESDHSLRMVSRVGSRNPVHCTALGKSILAHAGEEYLTALAATGLERRTSNTLVDLEALRADLVEIRARGYAVDREENKLGLRCIGAEVRDHQRCVVGAISISGPSVRIDDASLARLGPLVRRAADQIARGLGYLPVEGVRGSYR